MVHMDQYTSIAGYYDDLYGAGIGEDLKWFRHVLGEPPCRVLEIGCGTGRVSVELARMGYEVVGVDVSDGMLSIAQGKVRRCKAEAREKVKLLLGEIGDLGDEEEFDAVLAPFNVMNECLTERLKSTDFC
jgi:ubiquinone/menaquinone biosynthesis C-methylase UbiE